MRTLNIAISELEYSKFSLPSEKLTFTDFVDIISRELTRQNLNNCIQLAERYGLDQLTMDEISDEVKAVRNRGKAHS